MNCVCNFLYGGNEKKLNSCVNQFYHTIDLHFVFIFKQYFFYLIKSISLIIVVVSLKIIFVLI